MPATVAAMGSASSTHGWRLMKSTVSAKNISLERKPFISGTPAMAALATQASVPVTGMALNRPSNRHISRVPVS